MPWMGSQMPVAHSSAAQVEVGETPLASIAAATICGARSKILRGNASSIATLSVNDKAAQLGAPRLRSLTAVSSTAVSIVVRAVIVAPVRHGPDRRLPWVTIGPDLDQIHRRG